METNEEYAGACFAGSTLPEGPNAAGCGCTSDPVTGEESVRPDCEVHNGPKPPPPGDLTTEECGALAGQEPMIFRFPSGLTDENGNEWHRLHPEGGHYFGWNIRDGFRYRLACPNADEPGHAKGDTFHHHAEGGSVCWSCGFIPHEP